MERWSFNLKVYFLNSRFRQILDIRRDKKTIIQDRTIYEDAFIFAPNLHAMGLMTNRDYENYRSLFDLMESSKISLHYTTKQSNQSMYYCALVVMEPQLVIMEGKAFRCKSYDYDWYQNRDWFTFNDKEIEEQVNIRI